jgi:predicted Zn-dependent protease
MLQKKPGDGENCLGVTITGLGGIISTDAFSGLDGLLLERAIAALALHEIGHVLGRKGHCENAECMMQKNTGYDDFMARFVMPGLDFCRDCQQMIGAFVNRAMLGD